MFTLLSLLFLAHPFSIELEKNNVDTIVGQPNHLFIHFYTDGCPHCKKMAPEWNDLVRMYRPLPGFVMAAIDCGRLHAICESLEGTTTPSVRYFPPGQKVGVMFTGDREVGPLTEWVRNLTNADPYTAPGSLLFVPPSDIDALTNEGGWVLVAVDNHQVRFYNQTEIRSCEDHREIQFRALSNVNYRKEAIHFCRNDSGNCIFLTNGEETFTFEGEVDAQEIAAFLDNNLPTEL
jgi:thiol-disulfide isomerase/thioredoxin